MSRRCLRRVKCSKTSVCGTRRGKREGDGCAYQTLREREGAVEEEGDGMLKGDDEMVVLAILRRWSVVTWTAGCCRRNVDHQVELLN